MHGTEFEAMICVVLLIEPQHIQRTLTIGGSISVQLTSCLTGLDSTKKVNLLPIQHEQSS